MPIASPVSARTFDMAKLRTMTLETSLMYRLTPSSLDEESTPRMDLSLAGRAWTSPDKVPLTYMTAGPSAATASVKAAREETVVVVPPAPPVVLNDSCQSSVEQCFAGTEIHTRRSEKHIQRGCRQHEQRPWLELRMQWKRAPPGRWRGWTSW